jgi:putative endopeptidase
MNVPVFIGVAVNPDRKDSGVNALYLTQVPLGLTDRDFYLHNDADIAKVRRQYVRYVQSTLRLAAGNQSSISWRAAQLLKFEASLASASRPLAELRDPVKNHNRMTPEELTREAFSFLFDVAFVRGSTRSTRTL